MLKLNGITKDYKVGDGVVNALKGVDIHFRKNEFVSILGPSGCGKTTLLNIIGGLDHYTNGDLIINGVSTKQYNGRDWDNYRNHFIGFVFQSYNLIPHQTISENVELALSISGVDKAERVRRAHEALDKVGLAGQYKKKPNQLSGGQCQRVAIARALVNNPQILLADEPTGALDTETSVQIMELIKEVARDRLVIMVTHNPELADKYSTRIINLLDGKVVSDSNPYSGEAQQPESEVQECAEQLADVVSEQARTTVKDVAQEGIEAGEQKPESEEGTKPQKPDKKAKLSLWSAFKLSAKNLLSKFKRTFLVCLAGSIGIIGVATVLAVSSGVQNFIHDMQNDMLSGNPVTVSTEAFDMNALMNSATKQDQATAIKKSVQDGYINVDMFIEYLVSRSNDMNSVFIRNDITEEYVEFVKQMPKEYYAEITENFGLNLSNNLYTEYDFEGGKKNASVTAAIATYESMLKETSFAEYAQYISMFTTSFKQAPQNTDFIMEQYEFVTPAASSKIPTEEDEIMLVVSKKTELTDLMLAQYGYYTQDEFFNVVYKATEDGSYREELLKEKFSHAELMEKTFTWYPNDAVFNKNALSPMNPFTYKPYASNEWEGGKPLKVTAILRPKEDTNYGCMSAGFYYTAALGQYIINNGLGSQIVAYLNGNNQDSFKSMEVNGNYTGITYEYEYTIGEKTEKKTGLLGTTNTMISMMGMMGGGMLGNSMVVPYELTKQELGGVSSPKSISVYPTDFSLKSKVCDYLNEWNADKDITVGDKTLTKEERSEVTYTDNLAIVIDMVNDFIDIVTAALVAFTALSLVVSTVMIAIITYVSVIERVKEIGVIRSLGGRKRDVSALFNAETFIIGLISGVIGIAVTYLISGIINLIIGSSFGIYSIAALPIPTALIMIGVSIVLTLISGLAPASIAAKKDPVEALRSE